MKSSITRLDIAENIISGMEDSSKEITKNAAEIEKK